MLFCSFYFLQKRVSIRHCRLREGQSYNTVDWFIYNTVDWFIYFTIENYSIDCNLPALKIHEIIKKIVL